MYMYTPPPKLPSIHSLCTGQSWYILLVLESIAVVTTTACHTLKLELGVHQVTYYVMCARIQLAS